MGLPISTVPSTGGVSIAPCHPRPVPGGQAAPLGADGRVLPLEAAVHSTAPLEGADRVASWVVAGVGVLAVPLADRVAPWAEAALLAGDGPAAPLGEKDNKE